MGKIRDWLIGGITGLTIVKASTISGLLAKFEAAPTDTGFSTQLGDEGGSQ